MTTSNSNESIFDILQHSSKFNTTVEIALSNTVPDLGPPLRFKISIDDHVMCEDEVSDTFSITKTIPVQSGDNYLTIEHTDRDNLNTETDDTGNVLNTAMIHIDKIKINGIKFNCGSGWNDRNVFEPRYDDNFLEWTRKHAPGSNLPDQLPASHDIGIMGKLKIFFMWPLHLHGLYYKIHSKDDRGESIVTTDKGTVGADLKLFSDTGNQNSINARLTKNKISFENVDVLKAGDKTQKWFYSTHSKSPQLYKNGKWLADANTFQFITWEEL